MIYPSAEQVVAMHAVLLETYGGDEGGGHRGPEYEGADAAVQAVKNSYYETLEELAAALAVYIVQGHVFQDGNKRTGAAAMTAFLVMNDYTHRLSWNDIMVVMVELQERAENGEHTDRLVRWIAELLAK